MPKRQQKRWRISKLLDEQLALDLGEQRIAKRLHRMVLPNSVKARKSENPAGLKLPLYPYQREGMLHLVTRRRAILADEMGLGKTVQAIAACALLKRLGMVNRVLVVCPASLKSEWEEQIALFTDLLASVVMGTRATRLEQYSKPVFFTLVNYEQVLRDVDDIQRDLQPDVVVLDEAQRIKNWQTKTADAIKRLRSQYAFVLTGTPLENRIDEIYSIMQFINPEILGPLFRFNRQYYVLNDRGNPEGYKNLETLHQQLIPHMLRRNKSAVEGDLPPCSVRNVFVEMSYEQRLRYQEHEARVARLAAMAKKRPLTPDESQMLMLQLGCMRMMCDSVYITDQKIKDAPKLDELDNLLDELLLGDSKIIVFSEWVRMLELLRQRLDKRGVGYAVHTGSVPQHKRRGEINRFKNDPDCRLFLSSESGGAGLNLQAANVVINLDIPWNPAKLAQRIARAWRKHQTRSVQVINLVAPQSIEHGMLGRLESKQRLADGVLDGGLDAMKLPSGRAAMLEQLEQVLPPERREVTEKSTTTRHGTERDKSPQPTTENDVTSGRSPALLNEIVKQTLVDFEFSLRQVVHFNNPNNNTVLVVATGEQAAIKQRFAIAQTPEGKPCQVQVVDPEFFQQLQTMTGAGVISYEVEPIYLVRNGQRETVENESSLAVRLEQIFAPYRQSLDAAALLESNGFEQQSQALVLPVSIDLKKDLAELQGAPGLPAQLHCAHWETDLPTASELLAVLG